MTRNSRERTEDVSRWSKKSEGEALQNIINKFFDERNLKDLHLKHYHMSTAQLKKTTHLDIPGIVYDLFQHVVRTCPFCMPVQFLAMKTVSIATSIMHEVRTREGQCSLQIFKS